LAKKPEASFRDGVHSQLPSRDIVHRQSMYTPYSAGTPDMYYEAPKHSLWVEYKYLPKWKDFIIDDLLSGLQLEWAKRALRNAMPWAAIVGLGKEKGGIICLTLGRPDMTIYTKAQLAQWICLSLKLKR
jgi:hypothetical protein